MPDLRSVKLRLPLLIVALLGATLVGFGWFAHRQLSVLYERDAGTRLERASARLSSMLDESVKRLRSDATKLAADPALAAALRRPDAATLRAADTVLAPAGRTAGPLPSRALWSRSCTLVTAAGPDAERAAGGVCPTAPSRVRTTDAGSWVQPFVAHGDSVRFEVVSPVVSANDTLGYLTETRLLQSSETARVIGDLIGKDVEVKLGNAGGPALWTDLSRRVDGPQLADGSHGALERYVDAAGTLQIGVARDLAFTPWRVLVQLPRTNVIAPELAALRALALLALMSLLAGVAGAWLIGRHVTAPLLELTRAARELAQGRYERRVTTDRSDELGILVDSFNRMATQVEESTEELKAQAMELELRAEESQDLAHELEISNQELSEALELATAARRDSTIAESLLDEVLAQAPVGIAVFDCEMRYVRLNQAVADIHGVSLAAHLGKRPGELVPELRLLAEPLLERVLRTGEKVLEQRLSGTMHDGTTRHWLSSCFPIRGAVGEVSGAGAILVDTTAQQELEAQLLQAQKMEAVGRLAGGVAHDFNNLLTVITSYSTLALGTLREEDPLYDDMREIRSAAERAARLTKQLLAFSRKQVLRPQPLDLSQMAADMERMLQRLIGEDVTLELDLAPNLGAVSADPGQIEQVIMNLVVNSRDAMPSGGRVVIETSNAHFSTEQSMGALGRSAGEYVMLTVTDTGVGMSTETQAKLFEPFFTTKGAGLGTGLGLSTVYGIVKQSGGDIHVRSELGRGTTFRLYFPRLPDDRPAPSLSVNALAHSLWGTETILLVEDDEPLRNLASRVLREAGYNVLDTRTPTDAVLRGTHHPGSIDLLLTDVVMPQMSGRTVAELLTQQRPTLSVLYMSGYTDDDVVRRGVFATETEFLQKPFTPEQLLQQVRATLNLRTQTRLQA